MKKRIVLPLLVLVLGFGGLMAAQQFAAPPAEASADAPAPDASQLLGEEWLIEDIAGAGVVDDTQATLQFLPEGKLAGNATCNRIIGSYEVVDGRLTLGPAGTTMMACPEALMNQEQKLLGLLPQVESFRLDDTGALVLSAADGTTITARR